MLLHNPDVVSASLMFNLKVYGGTTSAKSPLGPHLLGEWLLFNQNDFMVAAVTGSYSQTTSSNGPSYASG